MVLVGNLVKEVMQDPRVLKVKLAHRDLKDVNLENPVIQVVMVLLESRVLAVHLVLMASLASVVLKAIKVVKVLKDRPVSLVRLVHLVRLDVKVHKVHWALMEDPVFLVYPVKTVHLA